MIVCFDSHEKKTGFVKKTVIKTGSDMVISIYSVDSSKQTWDIRDGEVDKTRIDRNYFEQTVKITKSRLLFWNVHELGEHKKDLIRNKLDEMCDIFSANDIICFAETLLENSDNVLYWVITMTLKKSILKR